MNKSPKLILKVKTMNCNKKCKECKFLHKNDVRFVEGTEYNPKCWVKCTKHGVWAEIVEELADKVKEDRKAHPWKYEVSLNKTYFEIDGEKEQRTLDDF